MVPWRAIVHHAIRVLIFAVIVVIFDQDFLLKKKKIRKTPFSISQNDATDTILARISESRVNTEDGNWKHISSEAKVFLFRFVPVSY
jgi:hypothetical protein